MTSILHANRIVPVPLRALALGALLALAPLWAGAATLDDGGGRTIERSLSGTSGALLSSGTLSLDGAAGQAAAGFSVGGALELTHGAFGGLEAEGEPEGEGEGGEGEPEGEGEGSGDVCFGEGPGVSAEVGASVCLSLPPSCAVDPVDPMYQWFKAGNPNALVDQAGILSGVNTATLCFGAVTLEDSGEYTLSYESGSKAMLQYSIELTVTPNALPMGGVLFMALIVALLAGLACLAIRHEASRGNNDLMKG